MLKRTFFVAKNNSKNACGQVVLDSDLKLLKSEFYLKVVESNTGMSSADETTSLSSTSTDYKNQQHAQQMRDYKDRSFGTIGSVFTTHNRVPLTAAKLSEFLENLEIQTQAYLEARRPHLS